MQAGDLISDKYRLESRLGEGGMAEVWSARNVLTQRDFAIKVILPGLARNREALDRFLQEAQATARLRHPSLVDVFDAGWTRDRRPYLVMDLLRGESLESLLERRRRLSPLWTALTIAPIARALDVAHRAGIVHRDLSSANVFLASGAEEEPPTPKVLDFGVSKILDQPGRELTGRVRTGDGAVLGSPAYMSPEQARGAECVDARSDVWSLGVLLYECLCGEPPFRAKNYNALMLMIIGTSHRPIYDRMPRLDSQLASLVESCLVKDREARTQTAREVAEELEAIAERLATPSDRRSGEKQRMSLPPRAILPAATLPVGVRLWQRVRHGAASRVLAVSGAIGGTAVGLALGVQIAERSRAASDQRASVPPPALPTPPAHARPEVMPVTPSVASEERDLVKAVARGLDLKKPKRKRPKRPSAIALAPRKNPY